MLPALCSRAHGIYHEELLTTSRIECVDNSERFMTVPAAVVNSILNYIFGVTEAREVTCVSAVANTYSTFLKGDRCNDLIIST